MSLNPNLSTAAEEMAKVTSSSLAVSVLIATRNRSSLLEQTIGRLVQQDIPKSEWELIIIDNGSSDATQETLARVRRRLPLVVFREPRPGKNQALNRALPHVRGDLVAFTDDDIIPDPGWLRNLLEAAQRWPDDTIFGGLIEPLFPAGAPSWLQDPGFRYGSMAFAHYAPAPGEGPVDELPFGPNLAIRREVLANDRFSESIGPSPMGSESELLMRLRARGHRCIYVPSARVEHEVRMEQTSFSWFYDRAFRFGRTEAQLEPPTIRTFRGVPLHLFRRTAVVLARRAVNVFGNARVRCELGMDFYRLYGNMHEYRRRETRTEYNEHAG